MVESVTQLTQLQIREDSQLERDPEQTGPHNDTDLSSASAQSQTVATGIEAGQSWMRQ